MANLESAIREIADVVEHLVHGNRIWNIDMTHDAALAKLALARVHTVTEVVDKTVSDAESGDLAKAADDVVQVVNVVKDAVQ